MEENNENLQKEASTLYGVNSRESLIASKQDEVILKVSDLDTKPLCRICYSGSSKEKLIRPCNCKGTIKYVHRQCLERWLEEKNAETCELCQHEFETKRTRKSCWEILRAPHMQSERRNLIIDSTCFAFVTPFGIATFWLCAEGAVYYQTVKGSTLETIALITLALFLVVAYFTWVILCTRYHLMMLTHWRTNSWNVRIVDRPPSDTSNDTSVTTPGDPVEDLTSVKQPSLRYTKEADLHIAVIDIGQSEMTPSANNLLGENTSDV